jgi:mannose-6-phosphate isomerase-like protein (cupin superfamily)
VKVVREADLPVRALVGRTSVVLFGHESGSEVLTHSVAYFDVGHAPGHTHVSDEVFYVDSGAGEVWLDGVPYAIGPGTLVHTPGNAEHNVHALPGSPVRLVAFASPHMVPGSYPDLPPRSSDLPEAATGRSLLVTDGPTDPSDGPGLGASIETERIDVAVRRIPGGDAVELAANGRDFVLNVLDGTGEIRSNGSSVSVAPRSAILLTGDDTAVLAATTDLRIIEGRATGWQASTAGTASASSEAIR